MNYQDIYDLRTALKFLREKNYEIDLESKELDTHLEIPRHFAQKGGGAPLKSNAVSLPTIYQNLKGHKMPLLLGLLNSRSACADMLGVDGFKLAEQLSVHVNSDFPPVEISNPPCQENVITENIDLKELLPVLTYTQKDAGPYITMGLVYGKDIETGKEDVTFHRLCVQDRDLMSIYFVPGRHIESYFLKAKKMNKPFPITVNIGLDPAIHLTAAFTGPVVPINFNELNVAGSIRSNGVQIAKGITTGSPCIAHSEIVIEGFITDRIIQENSRDINGNSMPEFMGYIGKAQPQIPAIQVTAVTFRNNPIYQTIIGPGIEQSNILGIPTETSIYKFVRESVTEKLINCYCLPSGGGKLSCVLQFKKENQLDDAYIRQAGMAAFAGFHELKNVYLVDEDVNIFDEKDILWAMATRFQGNHSIISIPNLNGHPLDPSQTPEFCSENREIGTTYKTVFDCTIPYKLKNNFRRANFE